MKSDLVEFTKGIQDITKTIQNAKIENSLIQFNKDTISHETLRMLPEKFERLNYHDRSLKRRYDYNSIIISLYGQLEQYLENIAASYIAELNAFVDSFENLPDKIKKNHLVQSIALINKVQSKGYSGNIQPSSIIANLNSCQSRLTYKLNARAYSLHTANFRSSVIDDLFSNIGVTRMTQKILREPIFYNQFQKLDNFEPENLSYDIAFEKLNDLSNRRNSIAHGVQGDILSLNICQDYVSAIYYLGVSIFKILYRKLLKLYINIQSIDCGAPSAVYKQGRVIVLNVVNTTFTKQSKIVGINENSTVVCDILGIQLDGNSVQELLESDQEIEVGILLDKKLRQSHRINIVNGNLI